MNYPTSFFVPGRINLLGEHIDYSGGIVLPAAIDLGVEFRITKSSKEGYYISSKGYGLSIRLSPDNREEHPWLRFFLSVLETAPFSCDQQAIHIELNSTLPSGYGLSSSTAVTCGFAHALCLIHEQYITDRDLIEWAVRAEHGTGTKGGQMDQHAVLLGKRGHLLVLDCTTNTYKYLPVELKHTELFLIGSGLTHDLLHTPYNHRRDLCDSVFEKIRKEHPDVPTLCRTPKSVQSSVLNNLADDEKPFIDFVWEENRRVQEVIQALKDGNEDAIGPTLSATHDGLSKKYDVSLPEMDLKVDFLKKHRSVIGARMMGGGFGGSILVQAKAGTATKIFAELLEFTTTYDLKQPSLLPFSLMDGLLTKG